MNIIDRAIAAFSPERALKRAMMRTQLDRVDQVRAIQTRKQKRRGDSWAVNDPSARPVHSAASAMSVVDRHKLRRIFRFNPFARKMKANLLNNLVAYGITATPTGSKKMQKEWRDWIAAADHDGIQDLYGLQELVTWTMLLDGEVFIVRRAVAGAGHPLRLQVLRVDQLDGAVGGLKVRDGIEWGEDGKPAFYHFRKSIDPMFGQGSERIQAADVIHLFRREEPGQWRGRSHFESVIEGLDDVDDYIEAEGVRKKLESCFAAFVETSIDADPADRGIGDQNGDVDSRSEQPIEALYPGMISYLDQGQTVKFGEPKAAGGFSDFLRWGSLRVAAGGEVTYEGMTGDLSNVNFSSFKAGSNEFETGMGRIQWLTIIPQFCVRVVNWWLEDAFATGRVGSRDLRSPFKHTPPRVKTIDRAGDAKAALLEMQAGIESRRNIIAERGNDHDELMEEIAADRAANVKRGIAFMGDPSTPGDKNASDASQPGADGSADDVSSGGDTTVVV
ncbi:phage portal protein [Sphingobium sp. LF-16]|uniref:phage portal protein n=1 Tax=Sphingobium sp. LF-16 TaxID=2185111 RepID=UPI000F094662|nr:phage portal protein [Sphingobium sp. LF-16]